MQCYCVVNNSRFFCLMKDLYNDSFTYQIVFNPLLKEIFD